MSDTLHHCPHCRRLYPAMLSRCPSCGYGDPYGPEAVEGGESPAALPAGPVEVPPFDFGFLDDGVGRPPARPRWPAAVVGVLLGAALGWGARDWLPGAAPGAAQRAPGARAVRSAGPRPEGTRPPPTAVVADLALTEYHFRPPDAPDAITGVVENRGRQHRALVVVAFTLFDRAGRPLGEVYGATRSLAPQSAWQFALRVNRPEATRCALKALAGQ